jgi:hypothetical protein
MPRRKAVPKRRRNPKVPNITNALLAGYQLNAVVHAGTGSNLFSFFKPGAAEDNSLNLSEIIQGMTNTGLFKPGAGAGKGWVVPGGGKPAVDQLGVGGAIATHLRANALPTAVKIIGSNVGVKVARKLGVMRNANRLLKTVGLDRVVRF